MVDNNVKTIVKDVKGSESVSALHALAYFVGQTREKGGLDCIH